jgi:hypothetical protein
MVVSKVHMEGRVHTKVEEMRLTCKIIGKYDIARAEHLSPRDHARGKTL